MPRGRPAKPTALKVIEGDRGKRGLKHDEPVPKGLATTPATLSKPAKLIWSRVVGSMPIGVYTTADETLLSAFCEAVALHRIAADHVANGEIVSVGVSGQEVVSPWVKIMSDQSRLIISLAQRLGFDPVARATMKFNEKDDAPSKFGIEDQ